MPRAALNNRIGRHGGVRTTRDLIEADRRASFQHLNWSHDLLDRLDHHFATTVKQFGVVDVVQEDRLVAVLESVLGVIHIAAEVDTTPISR